MEEWEKLYRSTCAHVQEVQHSLGSPAQHRNAIDLLSSAQIKIYKEATLHKSVKTVLKRIFMWFKKTQKLQVAQKAIEGSVFFREAFLWASQLGLHSMWKLTPISNVIKISEHFLLFFWKYPWFPRWSEDRCFRGKFIIKITNIFSSSNGGYKRRLDFLGQ